MHRFRSNDLRQMSLRLANNLPLVPQANPDNLSPKASRYTVVYRFGRSQALLDMVRRLCDPSASEARSPVLPLDGPELADAKDSASCTWPPRAFMALAPSQRGKTAPLGE